MPVPSGFVLLGVALSSLSIAYRVVSPLCRAFGGYRSRRLWSFVGRLRFLLGVLKMNNIKKCAVALAVCGVSALAMAEGESGFDPTTLMSSATSTVTGIVSALGTLLAAAAGIYLAFIGWRAFKAACNKV